MNYYSLNHTAPGVSFREATLRGQAPDKGLYFPERIPQLDAGFLAGMQELSPVELGFHVMRPYVGNTISEEGLYDMVSQTLSFPFPLVPVAEGIFSLELFHGPTLAFKDVGAVFMSRCLGYFSAEQEEKITVLVATSGDTGGAVANGFLGVEGVEVVILYPSGKVSAVQELQLTTCGQNIHALEIAGSFDDCQAMVKEAFMDTELSKSRMLTSANSINVARWLPQQLYYFLAWQQWADPEKPPVVAVPSGNFGNICAGLVARKSGLPLAHFIAACNSNNAVPEYLLTGNYQPQTAVATLSNAMDVGNPSNFIRVLELFQHRLIDLQERITGYTVSDDSTRHTIAQVFKKYGYVLDPHGAVAYHALEQYLQEHPGNAGIFLETAHPVKFPDTVESAIGQVVEVPDSARALFHKNKYSTALPASFDALKDWLLHH